MHRNEKERHFLTTFRRFGVLQAVGFGGAVGLGILRLNILVELSMILCYTAKAVSPLSDE
jgi:hypothetical protein